MGGCGGKSSAKKNMSQSMRMSGSDAYKIYLEQSDKIVKKETEHFHFKST